MASMGENVNQVLDENERLTHANGEIAGAAKVKAPALARSTEV